MTTVSVEDFPRIGETFNAIFSIVKQDKNYVKRIHSTMGGMWSSDKWTIGNTTVSLEDDGYTRRIRNDTYGVMIINTPLYSAVSTNMVDQYKFIYGDFVSLQLVLVELRNNMVVDSEYNVSHENNISKNYDNQDLGNILMNSIKRAAEEKAEKERIENEEQRQKINEEHFLMLSFVNSVKNHLIAEIKSGKTEPKMIVKPQKHIQWLNSVYNLSKFYEFDIIKIRELWREMTEFFKNNKITIAASTEYDGDTGDNWFLIRAFPLESHD